MNNQSITICDANVHPGEVANLALPLPEQYVCSPMYMPIKVINGVNEGPCLVVFSGLKGTELNGLEISNKIIKTIDPQKLSGTIIAIPVVNVYGLIHYPSTLTSDLSDISGCFPGDENGSYGQRIAHLFTQEILKKADYCIELQTGGVDHNILPQVYCNFDNQKTRMLAKLFNAPVITNVSLEDNLLRQTTEELNIPLLVYQAGEAMRFDENAIDLGVSGIKNIMQHLEMINDGELKKGKVLFSRDEEWLTANKAGILHAEVSLGQVVEEGEKLGEINDPFGYDTIEPIYAQQKGIIVGINTTPLIHEGIKLFKVVSFLDYDKAETTIEEWDQKQPDSYIG